MENLGSGVKNNLRPRVSIVIPMRNAESFVAQTLKSVLCEKEVPLEVVVVNDRSTDKSVEAVLSVRDERVRVLDGPGAGIAACINVGISAAKGEILMRCDADDLYPPQRIKKQLAWLDENSDYDAVCGGFTMLDKDGRLSVELPAGQVDEDITKELRSGETRTHLCTFAFRRSVIDRVGQFRPYFETAEDIDFQLRLSDVANVMYLPELFYLYRVHDDSITHTQGNSRREFFENSAREFQAQRRSVGLDDIQQGVSKQPPGLFLDLPRSADEQLQGILIGAAWREHARGKTLRAIWLGCQAIKKSPLDFSNWVSFLALVIKRGR
jgi:glycosyltransferase involved in cell wall biosynthesis